MIVAVNNKIANDPMGLECYWCFLWPLRSLQMKKKTHTQDLRSDF